MEDADVIKHDLSPDDFVTGARAWSLVQTGEMAAERFGFAADAPSRGPFAVRLNLLRDAAALCGFESVSGDMWDLALRDEAELTPADREVLGNTARLAQSDDSLLELWRYAAAKEGVRVPETVHHFDYVAGRSALLNWRGGTRFSRRSPWAPRLSVRSSYTSRMFIRSTTEADVAGWLGAENQPRGTP